MHGLCHIGRLGQKISHHKDICACSGGPSNGLLVDPAIHLDPRLGFASDFLHLADARLDELLTAPSRIDRHDQNQVCNREHSIKGGSGRPWIDRDSYLYAQIMQSLAKPVGMGGCLRVEDHSGASRLNEGPEMSLRRVSHKVHFKGNMNTRSQVFDELGSKGDGRHKLAIHDIEVNPISPGSLQADDSFIESSVVKRQDRRRDHDANCQPPLGARPSLLGS